MNFLLKCLFILILSFLINCKNGTSHEAKDNVKADSLVEKTAPFESIDSIDHLKYTWKNELLSEQTIKNVIKCPDNYFRIEAIKGSFADWLRHLPLKDTDSKVYLYNGDLKSNQNVHEAVIDIDVGKRDLQQCADAVMRLRAEYFYGKEAFSKIHFNYTSGDKVAFDDWMKGKKPIINGNSVSFSAETNNVDNSYANFKKYLTSVFSYSGTASLSKEMIIVDVENMQIGDIFIQGGFPGHAVIVVDMAINQAGEKLFLLAQSYMPAQEIHILKNYNNTDLSPWYSVDFGEVLETPEWTFMRSDLKSFRD